MVAIMVVFIYAGMAELADALDSGSSEGDFVQVQVLLPAPKILHLGARILSLWSSSTFLLSAIRLDLRL